MNQEINKIVNELYLCLPNDRNKFDSIMKNLKDKFLSSSYNDHQINYNQNLPKTNFNPQFLNDNNINVINLPNIKNNDTHYLSTNSENPSINPLKGNYNIQTINLPTYNVQNKQYELSTDNIGEYIHINNDYQAGPFNDNLFENKRQNDVHANYKYYYPEEFSSQFNTNENIPNLNWKNNNINNFNDNNNLMYGTK